MKLEVLQENLNAALNHVQRVVPTKPQLPILSSILLTAREKSISLAATDLYVGINTSLQGKTQKVGAVAIPGKIFTSSISSLDPGKLTLELKGDTLTISSPNNTTTIQCLPPDEFPDFPQIKAKSFALKNEVIEEIESKVSFSASIDPTRPVLTSLLFNFEETGLQVVGTDGFRLATLMIKGVGKVSQNNYLIPAKALSEVSKISKSADDKAEILFSTSDELKQALFEVGSTQLYVRLIEGEFPPYNKIIPSEFEHHFEFDGQEFDSLIKRAQVFARESSNIVQLKIDQQQMKVVATSPTYGTQEGEMAVNVVSGSGGEIAFNSKYLIDFLNALKPEKVELLMSGSLSPALLRTSGDENHRYIIMPFKVNE